VASARLPVSRIERRKARTREALIAAALRILVERGTAEVSIQQITDEADVGFGSFYNHFSSKSELFEAAVGEALADHGKRLQGLTADLDDPAEVFAISVRLTARLAGSAPAIARVFVSAGLQYLVSDRGLAPQAFGDLNRAAAAGRLRIDNPHLALATTTGCLLAYLQMRLEQSGVLTDDDADTMTEQLLVMFGLNRRSALTLAHRPLPG
jgi:AcrR family transcriptional regulator